jgi:hypothetical protein
MAMRKLAIIGFLLLALNSMAPLFAMDSATLKGPSAPPTDTSLPNIGPGQKLWSAFGECATWVAKRPWIHTARWWNGELKVGSSPVNWEHEAIVWKYKYELARDLGILAFLVAGSFACWYWYKIYTAKYVKKHGKDLGILNS